MSDFDDNLLDDLLSEGSSDSFFDDPKFKSNKSTAKKSETKKTNVSELFGLKSDNVESNTTKDLDWLGGTSSENKKPEENPLKRKPSKKVSFEEDILDTLGLESTGPALVEEVGQKGDIKKKALLDDIFGSKSTIQKRDITKETDKKVLSSLEKPLTASSSGNEEIKNETSNNPGFSLSGFSRESRRTRSTPTPTRDPLGLLSIADNQHTTSKKEDEFSSLVKTVQSSRGNTGNEQNKRHISWLDDDSGSVKVTKPDSVLTFDTNKSVSSENLETDGTGISNENKSRKNMGGINRDSESSLVKSTVTSNDEMSESHTSEKNLLQEMLMQRASSQGGYQNVSVALQQQESLLVMALQMKRYEDSLEDIQRKQQQMLNRQEEYFRKVVEEQVLKQHSIDTTLQMQQEKINRHIELLLSSREGVGRGKVEKETNEDEGEEKKEDKIVSLLKEKQHEEMFVLEESYKKQISLLEETSKSVEDRLRREINENVKYYEEFIENLNKSHKNEIEKLETKLSEMAEHHKIELKNLLENYKESKQLESHLVESSVSYVKKLDDSINILASNASDISEIKSELEKEYNILSKAREETLKAREKEIEMMRSSLEKARQISDTERAQLMALVGNLELKLAEQSQNSREDRWAFQQATSSLIAKMSAADREAEFQRAGIEREREQLKTLKENLFAEQEKLVLQLTEEKLAISAEKSRLEVSAKLANTFDAQKGRVEIEAAIKMARDAAQKTDLERANLLKAQHDLETCQRDLRDKEHVLSLKEKSLETLQRELDERSIESERVLAQAKLIESTYTSRTREMHKQLAGLAQREKKLAEEKLALSKERLGLQMDLRQLRRCTLCASTVKLSSNKDIFNTGYEDFDMDPEMARLRDEAMDDSIRSPLVEGSAED